MNTETDNQSQQQQRIQQAINYLIANQRTQQYQFSDIEKAKILNAISFIDQLKDQGASSADLLNQLEYLQDIYSFQSIEEDLYPDGLAQIGTHYNFYIFTHDGRREFDRHKLRTDDFGTFSTSEPHLFEQGFILLECQPQKMHARRDDVLLNTYNDYGQWTLRKTSVGADLTINTLPGAIHFVPDKLINGKATREVFDENFAYIHYEYRDTQVVLKTISITIDVSISTVNLIYGVESSVSSVQFDSAIQELPYNVYNYAIGFPSRSGNEQMQFEKLVIAQKLQEFLSLMQTTFNLSATKDPINSLYGQTSSVALSQIYEQLSTTISRKDALYELQTPCILTSSMPNEHLPSFKYQIPDMLRDNVDLFGQSWATLLAHTASIGNVKMYYPFKLKLADNIKVVDYTEVGGVVNTDYDLPNWRLTAPKFQINQYIDDKQLPGTIGWVEYASQQTVFKSTRKGCWLVANGKNYTVQADGILNVSGTRVYLNGMRLSIDIFDSWMPESKPYPVVFGYESEFDTTQKINVVISPSNLSIDGAPTLLTCTITYVLNGTRVTKNVTLSKQQIMYGNTTRPVYIGTLDTVTKTVRYVSGWTAMASFSNVSLYQLEYSQRVDGIPTTSSYTNLVNMKKRVKWPYVEQTIYKANSVGYTGEGATSKSVLIFSGDCPSDMGSSLCTMQPPFYPPQSVEYNTIFDKGPTPTRFQYETVVAFGAHQTVPDLDNMWAKERISFDPTLSSDTSEYAGFSTSEGFQPSYYRKSSTEFPAITDFWYYGELNATVPVWTDKVKGYTITQVSNNDQVVVEVEKLQVQARDLILPGSMLSQMELAESIVRLNSAVELLQYYATYLNTLIDNLDERLTYVEQTLQEVINVLTDLLAQQSSSPLGIAANIVNFLGVGIGMFFPLVGLGVSLIGGILQSAATINNGDVVTGVLDLVVGGMMASLGFYKWSQRLERKYGRVSQEVTSIPPEQQQDLVRKPGYGIIEPHQRTGSSSGLFHNTSYDYEYDNIQNTFIESTLTTRMTKQAPLWATIEWPQVDGYNVNYQSVWIRKNESHARTLTITTKFLQVSADDEGLPHEHELEEEQVRRLFDVNAKISDVVHLDLLYSLSYASYNGNLGIDDDIYNMVTLANGYESVQDGVRSSTSWHSKTWKHALARLSRKEKVHKKMWSIQSSFHKHRSQDNEMGCMPITPISSFKRGLDPYVQSLDAQLQLFENIVRVLN